jgi:hypothetical protein
MVILAVGRRKINGARIVQRRGAALTEAKPAAARKRLSIRPRTTRAGSALTPAPAPPGTPP